MEPSRGPSCVHARRKTSDAAAGTSSRFSAQLFLVAPVAPASREGRLQRDALKHQLLWRPGVRKAGEEYEHAVELEPPRPEAHFYLLWCPARGALRLRWKDSARRHERLQRRSRTTKKAPEVNTSGAGERREGLRRNAPLLFAIFPASAAELRSRPTTTRSGPARRRGAGALSKSALPASLCCGAFGPPKKCAERDPARRLVTLQWTRWREGAPAAFQQAAVPRACKFGGGSSEDRDARASTLGRGGLPAGHTIYWARCSRPGSLRQIKRSKLRTRGSKPPATSPRPEAGVEKSRGSSAGTCPCAEGLRDSIPRLARRLLLREHGPRSATSLMHRVFST
jgi:hypothetical protein